MKSVLHPRKVEKDELEKLLHHEGKKTQISEELEIT
jgi:hypothetical protein